MSIRLATQKTGSGHAEAVKVCTWLISRSGQDLTYRLGLNLVIESSLPSLISDLLRRGGSEKGGVVRERDEADFWLIRATPPQVISRMKSLHTRLVPDFFFILKLLARFPSDPSRLRPDTVYPAYS